MKDFIPELGCVGITVRLKRLADNMIHEGRKMYKELGLDIEPNWYIIFRLLKKENSLSVMEIAERIKFSHPSVISLTNKMITAGYLVSEKSSSDNRKRALSLTDKSHRNLPEFEKIWAAGEEGMREALEGTNAIEVIGMMEKIFNERGFRDRTFDELSKNE